MPQRLRITFARRGGAKYLSHLELMRLWERALLRAGWRVAYGRGFHPHPRISLAAALPVGVAGEAELLDVLLDEPPSVAEPPRELEGQLPEGIDLKGVEEVPVEAPTLQRLLRAAQYLAVCPEGASVERLRSEAARIMAAGDLPRERKTDAGQRSYDLRPMIHSLEVTQDGAGRPVVRMELRSDAQGAGRPDELLREMGLDPADCEITRLRLLLGSPYGDAARSDERGCNAGERSSR